MSAGLQSHRCSHLSTKKLDVKCSGATTTTPALGSGQPPASGQLPQPVRIQAEDGRDSASREASDPAVSPGRDSEMVSMLLQQVRYKRSAQGLCCSECPFDRL